MAMEKHNISQSELARKSGVSRRTIKRYIKDGVPETAIVLKIIKIVDALNIDPELYSKAIMSDLEDKP
jgi:transcriptional regulator with XRE-family HTH domain